MTGVRNSLQDERAIAMLEFALFFPLLTTVLVGILDYTMAVQEAMQVQAAATAGASFGAIPGNESALTNIQAAATSAAIGVTGFSVTATNVWTCSPGGASVASTATCSGGVTPYKYVVISTSGTVPSTFSYAGMPTTLHGSAVFQVPWSQ